MLSFIGKLKPHITRMVSRKMKKAIKNYPCKKTKVGRYLINILDSYYDYGYIGIGYCNGEEIFERPHGYDHPKAYFYKSLIDEKCPWRIDDYVEEHIFQQYGCADVSDRIDEFLEDWKNKNPFLEV